MSSPRQFNRIGSVVIWKGVRKMGSQDPARFEYENGYAYSGKLENNAWSGLNFKFDFSYVTDAISGQNGTGSASILGLSGETIQKLTNYATMEKNLEERNFLTVYAGYEGDGSLEDNELFTMPIVGAYPTPLPEMWLEFTGYSNAILSSRVSNFSVFGRKDPKKEFQEDVTIKQFCEVFCEVEKLELSWRMSKQSEEKLPLLNDGMALAGKTGNEVVEFLNSLGYLRARIENKLVGHKNGFKMFLNVEDIEENLTDANILGRMVTTISEANGMVGLPMYTISNEGAQLKVKTLLRKDIGIGDLIRVDSRYIRCIHPGGIYKVNAIRHQGEFRGTPWYTTFTALPFTQTADEYLKDRR